MQKSGQSRDSFEFVDVQGVDVSKSDRAVRRIAITGKPKVVECDLFIAGGGMGGIAAAIRALESGLKVCLTEETDWLGGQMTSQGVSALDENHQVENAGATTKYQQLRKDIRAPYRAMAKVVPPDENTDRVTPGNCWVSWLAFEPSVALNEIDKRLAEPLRTGRLRVFKRTKVVDLKVVRSRVTRVLGVNIDSEKFVEFRPRFVIDATELGDLLPLTGLPYNSGAESFAETAEPHAPQAGNSENVQDFTYPFVVEFRPGEKHVIPKPADYDTIKAAGRFSLLGYKMFEEAPIPGRDGKYLPFWTYRRLIDHNLFSDDKFKYDVSMINWESNDVRGENIIDQQPQVMAKRLAFGKAVSLSFLYWMQTELQRDDGGTGYPELMLRFDVFDTTDGLSKYPYIRESRRLAANKVVVEQEIAAVSNSGARAVQFKDSVGIGFYPIDIHGHQDVPGAGQASKPFQIPFASMVQNHIRNFLPACKNLGTTHVTNGAYRLHPIEWAIGEAAGETAAVCREQNTTPAKILANKRLLQTLQWRLIDGGAPLVWFHDVPTSHPSFAAIQFAAISGLMPVDPDTLMFNPDQQPSPELVRSVALKLRASVPDAARKNKCLLATWCLAEARRALV